MVAQRALHDLTVHAVARHASLRSTAVAAHLQADQGLALAQLLLAELSPIALSFPAHTKTYKGPGRLTLKRRGRRSSFFTCETSRGRLCKSRHPS